MNLRTKLVAGLAAVAMSGLAASAAGLWFGLPIVGGASYCDGSVAAGVPGTAAVCVVTAPAGPGALTGSELIPADTQLANGQSPQSVYIPVAALAQQGFGSNRNALVGGNFATNLWQRGTTFTTLTPTTATMVADRWFTFSTGNTVTISRQTGASDIILGAGLAASMRVNRPSGTDVTDICVGQVLSQKDATRFLGQTAVFSFWELNGGSMSATSGRFKVSIAYGTAAESATAGTNTGTFAASTLTGYTSAVAGGTTGTTATVAAGVATTSGSTTWTRYAYYASIPTTAINVGVKVCYTPVGTGVAADWIELAGAQLEVGLSTAPQPGSFAVRPFVEEAVLQQAYSQVWTDGAATIRYAMCQATTTTVAICVVPTAATMRIVPTTTVGTATSFGVTVAAGTAGTCTTLAAVATSNTNNDIALSCTTGSTLAAGNAAQLIGGTTAGIVTASAEP